MSGLTEQNDSDVLNESEESVRARLAHARVGMSASDGAAVTHHYKTMNKNARISGSGSAYGDFLFGGAGSLSHPAWSDSTGGRAIIRIFSRGIAGAAFYAIGGRMSRAQLQNYDPHTFEWKASQPLEKLAYGFDVAFGKPIAAMTRGTARVFGKSAAEAEQVAWNAVHFRSKSYYHDTPGTMIAGTAANGRTLGHEMVSISFDFAMMSVGDAMVRNFVQMIDPNIKKSWMVNDRGHVAEEGEKSHFSLRRWMHSTAKVGWRIFSKNQGEDWAVALPYVYQMKLQRHLLGKAFGEGSKVVFDNGLNGAAWKVREGKIVGDYQLPGALDLHFRFVGYNVFTLIFREGYDTVSNRFKHWKANGYSMHMSLPSELHPLDSLRKATRYFIKSTVKANMYMQPAVIPFWLMRSPQSKWRGGMLMAEAEKGTSVWLAKEPFSALHPDAAAEHLIQKEGAILNYNAAADRLKGGGPTASHQPETVYHRETPMANPRGTIDNPNSTRLYKDYKKGFSKSFSQAINPLGQFSYWLGSIATQWAHGLPEGRIKNYIGIEEGTHRPGMPLRPSTANGREVFMRNFVDASLAYTPYFWAKGELGLRVDDRKSDGSLGRMDKTIYALMDNVAGLHLAQAGRNLKEMWHLSTTINKDPISREGGLTEAEKRAQAKAEPPKTLIIANSTVRQPPVELARAEQRDEHSAENEGSWRENVSGRTPATPYLAPNHTRH